MYGSVPKNTEIRHTRHANGISSEKLGHRFRLRAVLRGESKQFLCQFTFLIEQPLQTSQSIKNRTNTVLIAAEPVGKKQRVSISPMANPQQAAR